MDPRWQTSQLFPLDLEPQYEQAHISKLNDTPTGTMTVPRPGDNDKNVGGGPIPGNPHPFLK